MMLEKKNCIILYIGIFSIHIYIYIFDNVTNKLLPFRRLRENRLCSLCNTYIGGKSLFGFNDSFFFFQPSEQNERYKCGKKCSTIIDFFWGVGVVVNHSSCYCHSGRKYGLYSCP